MKFENLEAAEVIKREKRFKLYIKYKGKEVLAYLPNPGRLLEIIYPSAPVYVMRKEKSSRKTQLEAVLGKQDKAFVSLNASLANKIFEENLSLFPIKVKELRREFYYNKKRYDFLINSKILVEVKSVTLVEKGIGKFPDAPTERGSKHLEIMQDWPFEKWVVFVVQREDAKIVIPNRELDERFYISSKRLKEKGATFFAFNCYVDLERIEFKEFIDVQI